MYLAIDISYFQGPNPSTPAIDWDVLKNATFEGKKVEAVVMRAGQYEDGQPSPDSTFERNYSECARVGLHKGPYYCVGANTLEGIQEEANYFASLIAGKEFDLPVYVDIEGDPWLAENANQIIDIFKATLKASGWRCGVYANNDYFKNYINYHNYADDPLWAAQYYGSSIDLPNPELFGMWQKSDSGIIDGIGHTVDINELYVPYWETQQHEARPVTETAFDIIHPPDNSTAALDIGVEYEVYIPGYGWTPTSRNGFLSGSIGFSKQLELVRIRLTNVNDRDIHIHYNVHIQDAGWTGFVADGVEVGAPGKRIEGIQIQLTGADAPNYSVEFRSHAQNIGTMDWAKDGELSGTEGASLRLEALAVLIVQKGVDLGMDGIESFKKFEPVKTIEALPVAPAPVPDSIFGQYFIKEEFRDDCGFPGHNGYSIADPCDGHPVTQYGKEANLNPVFYPVLNAFRVRVDTPVVINCGVRCPSDNEAVGGVWNSCHLVGDAVDLYVPGIDIVDAAWIMWNEFGVPVRVYPDSGFMHIELNTSLQGVYNQEGYYFM